jgi:iron complex transport system substrate-binding protein
MKSNKISNTMKSIKKIMLPIMNKRLVKVVSLMITLIPLCPLFFTFSSCGNKSSINDGNGDSLKFKYAENIAIIKFRHYTVVSLNDPWHKGKVLQKYVLIPRSDSSLVEQKPEGTVVYIPLRRSIVFTSSHCRLLSYLNAVGQIKGICDSRYVLSPDIKGEINKGIIKDCGDGMAPMIEKIVNLKADALLISPFENSGGFGKLETTGIPIIQCADYMEFSALGRAEWMKFYGMLYGREREADSLFLVVDSTYKYLKDKAIKLHRGRSIIMDRKTSSVWYCPGGKSTVGEIIADANGSYAFADDNHSGSLPLSAEQVLSKAENADVWAFKYDGGEPLSRRQLLSEYYGYGGLKAFRTGEIYECDSRNKPYFDETPFRPDYLLREMILLTHPEINELGKLRYYVRINK